MNLNSISFIKKLNKKSVGIFFSAFFILIIGGFVLGDVSFNKPFLSDHKEVQTDSGLKILFLQDESLPFIQYKILFPKAGADYDFKNKSGLSSLTAYLMEQGAGGLNSEDLQEELNQLGTELSISVNRQTVSITLSGLSWHREKLWELFQKVIAEPHFEEEELKILRNQLLQRRLKNLDRPGFVTYSLLRQRIFEDSLGQNEGGTLISLSKITLEDIKSFYKNQYSQGEPLLMVVGKYDAELKKNITSFFNDNFSYQGQKAENYDSPNLDSEFKLITREDLPQAQILLGYSSKSFPVDDPRKFLIFKIANLILGSGGMSNRLFLGLREEKGLTYHTSSEQSFGKFYGMFLITGSTKTSSVKEFLEEMLMILKTFREKSTSLEELQRAKQYLKSSYLQSMETPESRLSRLAHYTYYLGVESQFLENYLKILDSISIDEVNQIIKEFVLSKNLQVVVYGHPSLKLQLEGLDDFPSIKTISFEEQFQEELNYKAVK